LLLVEERVGGARDDEVVTGLRRGLCRALGEQLWGLDGVDAHSHSGLLAEDLGLPLQLIVGRGNEVVEREERQLPLLGHSRRAIEREGRRPDERDRGSFEEAPARDHSVHG